MALDVGLFLNTYHNETDIHIKPTYDLDSTVYIRPKANESRYITTAIIGIPQQQSDIHTLHCMDNKHIIDMMEAKIYTSNPISVTTDTLKFQNTTLLTWIKQNAPATIFTPDMKKPAQGTLQHHQDGTWYFHLGRVQNRSPISLPILHQEIISPIESSQITRGHPPFHTININQHQKIFRAQSHVTYLPRILRTWVP